MYICKKNEPNFSPNTELIKVLGGRNRKRENEREHRQIERDRDYRDTESERMTKRKIKSQVKIL